MYEYYCASGCKVVGEEVEENVRESGGLEFGEQEWCLYVVESAGNVRKENADFVSVLEV